MQLTIQDAFATAAGHEAAGRKSEARRIYDQILAAQPRNAGALLRIAQQDLAAGLHDRARDGLARALDSAKQQALPAQEIHLALGRVHLARLDRSAAAASVEAALAPPPQELLTLARLGGLALDAGAFPLAERCFREAQQREPGNALGAIGLTLALAGQQRLPEAQEVARRALEQHPDDTGLLRALGDVLKSSGAAREACAMLERCAARLPEDHAVRVVLGGACVDAGLPETARGHLERAIALGAPGGEVWDNLGVAYRMLKNESAALGAFERALQADPSLTPARANLVHTLQFLCEWDRLDDEERRLTATLDGSQDARWSPFVALAMPLSPAQQLAVARRWSRAMLPAPASRRRAPPRKERLRVGYLSASFHDHPTARLMAGLFEHHDRGRFEITGYSYGPDDGSAVRARVREAFDRWRDVRAASDADIAEQIRGDGIDVLIDRAGHTFGGRLSILASRPAPVQLHYMSYPGTLSYDAIDGVIADAVVVPPGEEGHFHERVWRLPRSYYVNDSRRGVPAATSRAVSGLPPEGLVLACLNQSYKLRRAVFATWLAALRARSDAVLWLLGGDERMQGNLRAEAGRAGVAPERLVFAPPLDHDAHVARLACADLALDTLPYGAHTSGCDALWMGVPMLTCRGTTFAGRVGASLLETAGLNDLIADSLEDYGTRLHELVSSPARLAAYREQLLAGRERNPLFDTAGFARDFEALLDTIYDDAAA